MLYLGPNGVDIVFVSHITFPPSPTARLRVVPQKKILVILAIFFNIKQSNYRDYGGTSSQNYQKEPFGTPEPLAYMVLVRDSL